MKLLEINDILELPCLPFNYRHFLPDSQGLYFVMLYLDDFKLSSIGWTNDLNKTIDEHPQLNDLELLWDKGLDIDIFYFELRAQPQHLEQWARQLAKHHNPLENKLTEAMTEGPTTIELPATEQPKLSQVKEKDSDPAVQKDDELYQKYLTLREEGKSHSNAVKALPSGTSKYREYNAIIGLYQEDDSSS